MKKITLPIKIIIIGCVLGLLVAGIGGIKQMNSKKVNEKRREEALKQSQDAIDAANKRLEELKVEYEEATANLEAKAQECDAIVTGSTGWFAAKNKCEREKQELQDIVWNLEDEDDDIHNTDYTVYYQLVKPMSYQIFYIIGGSVAGLALLGAFIIYLVKGKKTY